MIDTGLSRLYSPGMLSLATELHRFPLSDELTQRASARSRTCGSTIELGIETDPAGRISAIGMRVSACAVGQASCALLAKEAVGRLQCDIESARYGIESWLNGEGELPDWPGITALEPARNLSGRHGAILLPWNAAVDALSKASTSS